MDKLTVFEKTVPAVFSTTLITFKFPRLSLEQNRPTLVTQNDPLNVVRSLLEFVINRVPINKY